MLPDLPDLVLEHGRKAFRFKKAAAHRWMNAVNTDARFGEWRFCMANSLADVSYILKEEAASLTATIEQ